MHANTEYDNWTMTMRTGELDGHDDRRGRMHRYDEDEKVEEKEKGSG